MNELTPIIGFLRRKAGLKTLNCVQTFSLSGISGARFCRLNQWILMAIFLSALMATIGSPASATDKSATRNGLVQLPNPGGTIVRQNSSLRVDRNRGAVSISLPLPPLPSRAGISPAISIEYNQVAGGGGTGFGIGWRLNVPSIEVDLNYGLAEISLKRGGLPPLTLGGRPIVFLGTQDGLKHFAPRGSEADVDIFYVGERFDVDRAHPIPGHQIGIDNGFVLKQPDGRIQLFSGEPDVAEGGDVVVRYPLVYEVFPVGESIAYEYVKIGGYSYLSEVLFAGGHSRYKFEWLENEPALRSYDAGIERHDRVLYSRLLASFDDAIHAQWCFVHSSRSKEGREVFHTAAQCEIEAQRLVAEQVEPIESPAVLPELRLVLRFGDQVELTQNSFQLPPIHFDYSLWDYSRLGNRELVYPAPALTQLEGFDARTYEIADLNFDGLADVLRQGKPGISRLHRGNGRLDELYEDGVSISLERGERLIAPDLRSERFVFADLDGDARADILEFENSSVHRHMGSSHEGFRWLGAVPGSQIRVSASSLARGSARLLDVDMDGRSDLLGTSPGPDGQTVWRLMVNVGGDWRKLEGAGFVERHFELPWRTTSRDVLASENVKLVDVNADRLPDLVTLTSEGDALCVFANQGVARTKSSAHGKLLFGIISGGDAPCFGSGKILNLPATPRRLEMDELWFVDVNGDGLLDIATLGSAFDEILVWFNFGDLKSVSDPLSLALSRSVYPFGERNRSRSADVDGDGISEIVVFQGQSPGDSSAVVIDFNRTPSKQLVKPHLLTELRYESGLRYEFYYSTTTDELLRDRRNETAHEPLHFPSVVIKRIVETRGEKTANRITDSVRHFYYRQPSYDFGDRAFRGFAEVDQVIQGDELCSSDPTIRSSMVRESFHKASERQGQRELAGRLISRKHFSVSLGDSDFKCAVEFAEPDRHSLLTETQNEERPKIDSLLKTTLVDWEVVERPTQTGTWFIRRIAMEEMVHSPGDSDTSTRTEFLEFDEHNLPGRQVTEYGELRGPHEISIPASVLIEQFDYATARKELALLGIKNKWSKRTISTDDRLLVEERVTHDPNNGQVLRHNNRAPSRLETVPEELLRFHKAQRQVAVSYEHDQYGNVTSVSDNVDGLVETVRYDVTGVFPLSSRIPDPNGGGRDHVVEYQYGDSVPAGMLAGYKTALGVWHWFSYDSLGRRARRWTDDGLEERYAYRIGAQGAPSLVLTSSRLSVDGDLNGGPDRWKRHVAAYRSDGRLLAKIEPNEDGAGVRILQREEFNRNGQLTRRWVPYVSGELATGEQAKSVGAISQQFDTCKEASSNSAGLCTLFELGQIPPPMTSRFHRFQYDPLNRLIEHVYPGGKEIVLDHRSWGVRSDISYADMWQDQVRSIKEIVSDERGIHAISEAPSLETQLRETTEFGREASGVMSRLKLPGKTEGRTFLYDGSGLLEYQQIPGMGERYATYDGRGRQTALLRIDSSGKLRTLITREYDSLDRVTSESYDGVERFRYEYDRYSGGNELLEKVLGQVTSREPFGQLISVISIDPHGLFDHQKWFTYDQHGRLIKTSSEIGGERHFVERELRLDGVVKRFRNSLGVETIFDFGLSDRLKSIQLDGLPTGNVTLMEKVVYNPMGQIGEIHYRGENSEAPAFTKFSYDDETMMLERIKTEATWDGQRNRLQDMHLDLNGNGSVNQIRDAVDKQRSGVFEYDWKDQIVKSERFGQIETYQYTQSGLLYEISRPGGQDHAGGAAFDGFGQLESSPTVVGTVFDALGRLIEIETKESVIKLGYMADGSRSYILRSPKDTQIDASTTLFPLDGIEIEGSKSLSLVYLAGQRLAQIDHGSGNWYYYLKDQIGSSDFMLDSDGRPVAGNSYSPFGREISDQRVPATGSPQDDIVTTNHLFAGQYLESDSGLYDFGNRFYDPSLGRFISPDPRFLAEPELCSTRHRECNLYSYALNNPLKLSDADGTLAIMGALAIGWAVTEIALSLYDAYDLVATLSDSKATTNEKAASMVFFAAGIIAPGGGYGAADDAVRGVGRFLDPGDAAKFSDELANFNKLASNKNQLVGRQGEVAAVFDYLHTRKGYTIIGRQMAMKSPSGKLTYIDLLVADPKGKLRLIEVKSGRTSWLTQNQSKFIFSDAFKTMRFTGPKTMSRIEAGLKQGVFSPEALNPSNIDRVRLFDQDPSNLFKYLGD